MRRHLIQEIRKHIGSFVARLPGNPTMIYDFMPIPQISYPMVDPYFKCGIYYVPYLLKEKTWPIDDPEKLLAEAQAIVKRYPPPPPLCSVSNFFV